MMFKAASSTAERTCEASTARPSPDRASGVRAKTIGGAWCPARSNRTLRSMRADVADLLAAALAGVKPDAIAVGMNATRTLVSRWLDARWSDKRPAPIAMLLALDATDFEAVIARLIEARKERGL